MNEHALINVETTAPRKRGRPRKWPTQKRLRQKIVRIYPNPTRDKLRLFLAQNPNACEMFTLEDIGSKLGVSRERIRQLMPNYAQRRLEAQHRARLAAFAKFIEENPRALLTRARGGMTLNEIAKASGMPRFAIGDLWRELDLPDRSLLKLTPQEIAHNAYVRNKEHHRELVKAWVARHPDKVREMNKRAQAKYHAKVLRQETCEVCGKVFDWTQSKELHRNAREGRGIVCGPGCGRKRAAQRRRA